MAVRRFLAMLMATLLGAGAAPAAVADEERPAKPAVVRFGERNNEWHLRETLSGGPGTTVFRYGRGGEMPLLCDWNGDGTQTPGIVRRPRPGQVRLEWHLRNSNTPGPADVVFTYGRADTFDQPVCGDWNGDGIQTPGVVRERFETDGRLEWHLRNRNAGGPADITFVYGRPDGMHWTVVGDWDGDGVDTPGVIYNRERLEWHLRVVNRGGAADVVFRYGLGDPEPPPHPDPPRWDSPIVGDWTGDGRDTPGVLRERNGSLRWLLRHALRGGTADEAFTYGRVGDLALTWQ